MANIFDLGGDYGIVYRQIANGEDSQVYLDTLESINDSIEDKADNYTKVIRSLEGDNEALDKEIKRLQARKKSNETAIVNMKQNLQFVMEQTGKTVFKTQMNSFGIQRNAPSVKMIDETLLPETYYKEQQKKLDKKQLLEDLKAGEEIEGVELQQTSSLRIK